MFKQLLAATFAIAGTSVVMASMPSPMMSGVQRVVISCEVASGLSESEHNMLCHQLVSKAAALTALPVSLASAMDLDAKNMARQHAQLLLRVSGSAVAVEEGRKTITLTVTPLRAAAPVAPRGPIKSTTSFLKVQGDWVLQGHVKGFTDILGAGPRELRRPIRADI